jgi:hypothetical protein
MVAHELHGGESIVLVRPRRFLEDLVDGGLEVGVEGLEKILEQKCQKLTRTEVLSQQWSQEHTKKDLQLQPLITDVVSIVDHFLVIHGH